MQILPGFENPSWILESGLWGCYLAIMCLRNLTLAYLCDFHRGFIFSIIKYYGTEDFRCGFCNSYGPCSWGPLDKAVHKRRGSRWLLNPLHHINDLGTPSRAPKSRGDGKGQQTLSICKSQAELSPSFITEQPKPQCNLFSVENLWPCSLSIVVISMNPKHILNSKYFAWCPQEREFPQMGPSMYFVWGIL